MRRFNLTNVLVLFSVGLVGLAVGTASDSLGSETLGLFAMNNVRGAEPACNANYSYAPCTENAQTPSLACMQHVTLNQCQAQTTCAGCTGAAQNDICTGALPWNSVCLSDGSDPTGCGKFHTLNPLPACNWNAATNKCRCLGQPDETKDCARQKATQFDKTLYPCEKKDS